MYKFGLAVVLVVSFSLLVLLAGCVVTMPTIKADYAVDFILFQTLLGKTRNRDAIDFAIAILDIWV
jgi:hypothetical protein